MAHRIREAMKSNDPGMFGEGGGMVEVDETFIGREPGSTVKPAYHHKMKVLALVDRSTGRSRAVVVDGVTAKDLVADVRYNIAPEATLMTDEATAYQTLGRFFSAHHTVNHGKLEYGRGPFHTNTVEGYFSIFKRGMKGVYQHCEKKHLHRYLAEFDFRYTNRAANGFNDAERTDVLLSGVVGRRLTYQTANRGA